MKYPIRPSTLKSAKRSPTTCRIQTHSNYLVRGASQRTFVPVRAGGIGRLRLSLRSPIFAALRQTREVLIPPADYSQSLAPGSGREIPRVWPMAEKEGFEPPVELPLQLISSQSHSTTLALLHLGRGIKDTVLFNASFNLKNLSPPVYLGRLPTKQIVPRT